MTPEERDKIIGWMPNFLREEVDMQEFIDFLNAMTDEPEFVFCKGAYWLEKAMNALENVPEIDSWYMDEEVTNAYNEIDDVLRRWQSECKEYKLQREEEE